MTAVDDVLRTTVSDLLINFRSVLVAAVPSAERIKLAWRDDNPHDDWERLAECMFDVFVRATVEADRHRLPGEYTLPRYDFDVESYHDSSWISVAGQPDLAFVRLLSRADPFDTVQLARVEPSTHRALGRQLVAWRDLSFELVRRNSAEPGDVASVIEVSA